MIALIVSAVLALSQSFNYTMMLNLANTIVQKVINLY